MSLSNLLINVFFVLLGALVSTGLAIWIEVSGVVDRFREKRAPKPASRPLSSPPGDTGVEAGPPVEAYSQLQSSKTVDFLTIASDPRLVIDMLKTLLGAFWELRYFFLGLFALGSGFVWLEPLLVSRGASTELIRAVLLGYMVATFGVSAWILTKGYPPIPLSHRIMRSITLVLATLGCFAIGVYFESALLGVGLFLGSVWAATRSWANPR